MGPQPPEAEPAIKRARSVEAPGVCDLEENTLPRLPRRTEVEGEGCRERELAHGGQPPGARRLMQNRGEEARSRLGEEGREGMVGLLLGEQLTGTQSAEPLTSCS